MISPRSAGGRSVHPVDEYVCGVCELEFDGPVALLEHEEREERQTWLVDGLGDT